MHIACLAHSLTHLRLALQLSVDVAELREDLLLHGLWCVGGGVRRGVVR